MRVLAAVVFVSLAGAAITAQQPGQQSASTQSNSAGAASSQLVPQAMQDAEALIAQSNWKAAAEKLNGWLAEHPSDAQALFDAGYVADAQNHPDEAAAFYKKAVDADASNFMAHLSLGLLLARQGKLDEARPELVAATKLDASHAGDAAPTLKARAWRALAQIDHTSDPSAASNDLVEALKLSPETPQDTLLAAELAEQADEPDAAEKAYRRLLVSDPKSEQANAGLAHLLIARKQFPEAEKLLRTALAASPDDPALTAQLAVALAAQDKGEALPLLEKLHAAHAENAAITRMLAEVRAEAGDTSGSDQLYTALLATNPHDPRTARRPRAEPDWNAALRRSIRCLYQGNAGRADGRRRMEWAGLCGLEDKPAYHGDSCADRASKNSPRQCVNLFSVGDILRCNARPRPGNVVLSPFSGRGSRQVSGSGMASAAAVDFARKEIEITPTQTVSAISPGAPPSRRLCFCR